jgi:phage shock protein A
MKPAARITDMHVCPMVTPGLPSEVLEYVRLGYEAARVHAPAAQAPLPPTTPDTAVRRVIAALEGQVRSLRDERAQLLERCGRLEEELAVSRVVAQEFASAPRELQHQLDQAHETIGRLRAELAVAKAAVRTPRAARRTGSTARRSNVGKAAGKTAGRRAPAARTASNQERAAPKGSARRGAGSSKSAQVRTPGRATQQRSTGRKRTRRKLL